MRFISVLSPYLRLMRLHQPTGIWLLLWPCLWSIALASHNIIDDLDITFLFVIGAVVMRGAGCVINDIWDRNIDPYVERTKNRPLARGEVNVSQALIFLALLLGIGLLILFSLNKITIMLGLCFAAMVAIYPLAKPFMSIPQIFLGLTINAGALMGWSAVTGELSYSSAMVYAACFFWTLGYDTIYAHQDKKDDKEIGVKSSALTFGSKTKIHVLTYYMLMIIFLILAGFMSSKSILYYLMLIVAIMHFIWQVHIVDLDDRDDCMKKFRSNGLLGWIIFAGSLV